MQGLVGEIYEGKAFTTMHRVPALLLLTPCHHLLPAHRVCPGMGLKGQGEEGRSLGSSSEKERSRGEPGTRVGKHRPGCAVPHVGCWALF